MSRKLILPGWGVLRAGWTGVGFSVTSNGPSLPGKLGDDKGPQGSIQRSCDEGELS